MNYVSTKLPLCVCLWPCNIRVISNHNRAEFNSLQVTVVSAGSCSEIRETCLPMLNTNVTEGSHDTPKISSWSVQSFDEVSIQQIIDSYEKMREIITNSPTRFAEPCRSCPTRNSTKSPIAIVYCRKRDNSTRAQTRHSLLSTRLASIFHTTLRVPALAYIQPKHSDSCFSLLLVPTTGDQQNLPTKDTCAQLDDSSIWCQEAVYSSTSSISLWILCGTYSLYHPRRVASPCSCLWKCNRPAHARISSSTSREDHFNLMLMDFINARCKHP